MTDQARKRQEVKKHVSALLISVPAALTVSELKRDYLDFLGTPLDFRGLGYSTIEDFIRDCEDIVHIGWKNGMMTVTGKADDTTQHIARLVSKQKVNKKKYAVYRPKRSGPPMQWQGLATAASQQAPQHHTRHVPPQVRDLLRQFFSFFPTGIELSNFQQAFCNIFGFFLGVKVHGFNSLEEVFQFLSDTVTLKGHGKDKMVLPVKSQHSYDNNFTSQKSDSTTNTANVQPNKSMKDTNNNNNSSVNNQKGSSLSAEARPLKGRGCRKGAQTDQGSERHVGHSSGSNKQEKIQVLVAEIQQVLADKPEGVWCSKLAYEYSDLHGQAIDFRKYGYMSLIDFIANEMPESVKYVRPALEGDWRLYDAKYSPPVTESDISKPQKLHASGQTVEAYTRESIQKILANHHEGVPLHTFPDLFKAHTGSRLPTEELGFKSAEDLALSLADSVLQIAYSKHDGLMMYPINADIPDDTGVQEPDQPLTDFVGPGCHYVPEMCPDRDQYVELYVSNIISPGLFWVILRHKTRSLALEALMDKLDEVYTTVEREVYQIPDSMMTPGQVCVTLFPEENNWHRGVITGKNEAGFIKVYFVDYGNTAHVPKNTIRFLRTDFLSLPAQAIQCRLANIHPSTGKWKVKSRNRMLELCKEKPLVAYITDVKAQVMSVCLTDTNNPNIDIHINDLLVREGYAVFTPDIDCALQSVSHLEGAPDYSHVFGWGVETVPRLPHCARAKTSCTGSTLGPAGDASHVSEETVVCYIKWVQVTSKHMLHLINLERIAYLISAEISSLLWEEDILTSMLKQQRLQVAKRVISRDEYPYLFNELEKYKVRCIRAESGDARHFLSLYQLNDVPGILKVFKHESQELITALEEMRDKFDPDSPFWKDHLKTEEEEDVRKLTVDEQQRALLALQIKRKRILQLLMSNPDEVMEHMNELHNSEMEILVLKKELEKSTYTNNASVVAPPIGLPVPDGQPSSSQSAENHRVIQNIMASTTKPIATANIMTKAVTSTATIKTLSDMSLNRSSQPTIHPHLPQTTLGTMHHTQTITSHPSMMGVATGMQRQRFLNSSMISQTPHLDLALSKMVPQTGTLSQGSDTGIQPEIGMMPSGNYELLPGLFPLLQSLSLGRGIPFSSKES